MELLARQSGSSGQLESKKLTKEQSLRAQVFKLSYINMLLNHKLAVIEMEREKDALSKEFSEALGEEFNW